MMGLLVYKEKLKNFYAEHEFYVNPIIKFISAFIALTLIKKNVGYNDLLTMWPVIMGISVIMAFMPWTIIITALTAIMCINIFTLSIELGATNQNSYQSGNWPSLTKGRNREEVKIILERQQW